MGATCSRHAPRSHMPDFSRSNARGRGDLHSDLPKLRMDVPKAWQARNTTRLARHERSVVAVPSEGRLSPCSDRSLGVSTAQIDGLGWPRAISASTLEIRAKMRVFRGPDDRQAPIFRQESEGGIRRRIRKQPGGESGRHWCLGMEPSVASSWHAWSAIWRLTPRPWERRMLRSG
jgi:hypothetical protein